MSIKKAKEILMPASRQHQHNDCSGLIMAYDYEATLYIVAGILEQRIETRTHETIVNGQYELLPHGYEIHENDECLLDNAETWVRVEKWMVGMENSNVFNPIRRISL